MLSSDRDDNNNDATDERIFRRKPIKWTGVFSGVLDKYEQQKRRMRDGPVYRRSHYSDLKSFKEMNNSGRMRLDSLEGAFRYLVENSDLRLGSMQKVFKDTAVECLLPRIFGADLVGNLKYLMKKYLLVEVNDTMAALCPRRSGKTVVAAILIAVIAVSQPDGNCIMYNLTAAQAEEFLDEAVRYLKIFEKSPEFGWVEVQRDVRKLIKIRTNKYGTINSIKSKASAMRGDATIDFRMKRVSTQAMTIPACA